MSYDAYLKLVVEPSNATVDIVAVHGLNPLNGADHAEATWTAPNGKLWLRDFLPNQMPQARIFLFSYNANPAFNSSSEGVHQQANNLLVRLDLERDEAPDRPLYFICHSLGGLIVKRAIVQAQQGPVYSRLFKSVQGLVFFGTPHRGGNNAGLGDIAASIARSVLHTQKNDYLEALKKNSFFSEAIRDDFRNRLDEFQIVTIYESRKTKGVAVVDRQSAVLGLGDDRETVIGMDADHSAICKFGDADGLDYLPVWKSIKRLVQRSLERLQQENDLLNIVAPSNSAVQRETIGGLSDLNAFIDQIATSSYAYSPFTSHAIAASESESGLSFPIIEPRLAHTSAYQRWLRDGCGILACTFSKEQGASPAIQVHSEAQADEDTCAIYTSCLSQESHEDTSSLTHSEICLSLIVGYLRIGCMQEGRCNLLLLSERIRELAQNDIDFTQIAEALRTRSMTARPLLTTLSQMLQTTAAEGDSCLVVINDIQALGKKSLSRHIKDLSDTVGKDARILLAGTELLDLKGLGSVPRIDETTESKEFLQSLHFEQLHLRRDLVQDAHSGTNNWIFDHSKFQEWDRQKSGILWIQGKPGSGKSVLAKSFIKRNSNALPVIGWFYSRRHGDVTTSHVSMLKSILYQVHQQDVNFVQLSLSFYRKGPPFDAGQQQEIWSFQKLSAILARVATSGVEMICIIDGLDESESENRKDVLAYLADIVTQDPKSRLKFMVLSRPSSDITSSLRTRSNKRTLDGNIIQEGCYVIVMQNENRKDIQSLVDDGIQRLQKLLHPFAAHDGRVNTTRAPDSVLLLMQEAEVSGLEEMRQYLIDNANGVILWVALVLETVSTYCRHGGVTIQQLKSRLKELPLDLEDLYKHLVQDLKRKPQDIQNKSRKIFMLVSAASLGDPLELRLGKPLGLREIWDLLAVPENFEDALIDERDYRARSGTTILNWAEYRTILSEWCGPFLEIVYSPEEENQTLQYTQFLSGTGNVESEDTLTKATIQLLHQTVKDFFADQKASGFLHFTEDDAIEVFESTQRLHQYIQRERFTRFVYPKVKCTTTQAQEVTRFFRTQYLLLYSMEIYLTAFRYPLRNQCLDFLIHRTTRLHSDWKSTKKNGYEDLSDNPLTMQKPGTEVNAYMHILFHEVCSSGSTLATQWVMKCCRVQFPQHTLYMCDLLLSQDNLRRLDALSVDTTLGCISAPQELGLRRRAWSNREMTEHNRAVYDCYSMVCDFFEQNMPF